MAAIGMLFMLVGWLMTFVGGIMVLIKAFQKSIVWGLCSLFIPFVIFVFAAMNFAESKKGLLVFVAGIIIALSGVVLAALFAGPAPVT